ncbi:MAG: PGPGW domain-containing protein, partial [Anaerolineales bacterium]
SRREPRPVAELLGERFALGVGRSTITTPPTGFVKRFDGCPAEAGRSPGHQRAFALDPHRRAVYAFPGRAVPSDWYPPHPQHKGDRVATARGMFRWIGRNSRRVAITIVGFVLLLAGLAGLALPLLPGWLLLIAGLAVLGTEYMWARRMLDEAKKRAKQAAEKVRRRKRPEES